MISQPLPSNCFKTNWLVDKSFENVLWIFFYIFLGSGKNIAKNGKGISNIYTSIARGLLLLKANLVMIYHVCKWLLLYGNYCAHFFGLLIIVPNFKSLQYTFCFQIDTTCAKVELKCIFCYVVFISVSNVLNPIISDFVVRKNMLGVLNMLIYTIFSYLFYMYIVEWFELSSYSIDDYKWIVTARELIWAVLTPWISSRITVGFPKLLLKTI